MESYGIGRDGDDKGSGGMGRWEILEETGMNEKGGK